MTNVKPADRLSGLPSISIWEEMTPLAIQHKAVNLGQGFPSLTPPQFLLDELQKVIADSAANPLYHQYCPVRGHPELVTQLRKLYSRVLARDIAPNEVVVTDGVTQALNATINGFVNRGDEVIVFEPFYDAYFQDIHTSGAVVKRVQLKPSTVSADDWSLSEEALRAAVSPKSKLILLNTPQNVPGKVWGLDELQIIAKIANEFDILVAADEVYMHLIYDKPHISIATLPGMWERTLTMCSAGKTFSCTGWKVGWVIGSPKLTATVTQMVSYQTFCCSTPFQIALGRAMAVAETNGYYESLVKDYRRRIAFLTDVLKKSGLPPIAPSGGFFVMVDITTVDPKHYYDSSDKVYAKDWQFCRWLTKTIGVAAIPSTAFCGDDSKPVYENYVRFACCKPDAELEAAAARLAKLREYML